MWRKPTTKTRVKAKQFGICLDLPSPGMLQSWEAH